jgi:hypothetical protein
MKSLTGHCGRVGNATAPTKDLNVGRAAIGLGYGMIGDDAPELGAEGAPRFGLPYERRLKHSARSDR